MKTFGKAALVVLVLVLVGACQPAEKQPETATPAPAAPAPPAPSAPDVSQVVGNWTGVLDAQGAKYELLFKVSQGPNGTVKASIDSVSQGVKDIPVEDASFKDGRLLLEAKSILGVLDVTLADSNTLRGNWNQAGRSYPLELKRVNG